MHVTQSGEGAVPCYINIRHYRLDTIPRKYKGRCAYKVPVAVPERFIRTALICEQGDKSGTTTHENTYRNNTVRQWMA